MDRDNILKIISLNEINSVALELIDEIDLLTNEEPFLIQDEIVNKYEVACSEITRLKVIRNNNRKKIQFDVLADKMTEHVKELDFIGKFSTNDLIRIKKNNFNNETSNMNIEVNLSELEKDIEDYYTYYNKADELLKKFNYFKFGVNNNESTKIVDLISEQSYEDYLKRLFKRVLRLGEQIGNSRFDKKSEMYLFDNNSNAFRQNKAILHRDGKVFNLLVKQLLILIKVIKNTTPIINKEVYSYIYSVKQSENINRLMKTNYDYYVKNQLTEPLLPTSYLSYYLDCFFNRRDVTGNFRYPLQHYCNYMGYIFAKNSCINEINKTRIGLLIDILEKNEIHNYVNDIFYAKQE